MRTLTTRTSCKRFMRSTLCLLLAVMALFSATTSAFAAEEVSYETPILSEEDGVLPMATNSTLVWGENHIGNITFTGYNGGSYRTIPTLAKRMRIRIYHKDVDNLGVYHLTVSCIKYIDSSHTETVFSRSVFSGNTGGPYTFDSGYFDVTPGCDYRLIYTAKNQGGYYEDRRINADVYLDIAIV